MLTTRKAGLFSAVTSAFIVLVHSQLQPNPNDETAALLRVVLYKMDNATFGGDVPAVPHWPGPPRSTVHIQTILYASLTTALFSAFLAMLGKQWSNRYASTDVRGTTVERSQNRQQKLNGIVVWYFDNVMESLPLMLQAALLLLGCALSRYLWEIDTMIASVVLGVTSFGVIFYLFIVVAGSASASCPYQTPGSRAVRSVTSALAPVAPALASAALAVTLAARRAFKHSNTVRTVQMKERWADPWWSRINAEAFLRRVPRELPGALATDLYYLGLTVVLLLVAFTRRVYVRLAGTLSIPTRRSGQQTTLLDSHCISWILQTSLDKFDHLSAVEYLATMAPLPNFDPILVAGCFSVLISCVKLTNDGLVVTQGLEQLATASAMCLLRTFSHLSLVYPISGVLGDVRQRYNRAFPLDTDFKDFPFYYTLSAIHRLLNLGREHWQWARIEWQDYNPPSHEHVIFARALVELTRSEYRREKRGKKVPRWILRFVLHSLSLVPLPSVSVIVDCLSIIAIDLDCDISSVETLDERYVHA